MITNRSLRFALCALLLLAPLATLAAQEMQDDMMMKDDGSFYVTAAYGVALPADRKIDNETISTDLGFLGGQIGVGYSIFGFRPELSVGYRMANIKDQDDQSVTTMDVIASVYYDVDTGSEITPYIGVGGGISNVTVKQAENKSVLALAFQAAAGIGYAVTEDLTLTLGYRLTGAMDADFPKDKGGKTLKMALGHHVELGIRYSF